MKKAITLITIMALFLLALCSCEDTSSVENQGNGSAYGGGLSDSNLGDYNVIIESCRFASDYEGEPIVIVKYKFTNNSNEPASFWLSVNDAAYQDGVGLNECYFASDSANYSSDNQTKDIKKGASISVEVAYVLNDSTTEVEIEVSENSFFNDKKITKKFSIVN